MNEDALCGYFSEDIRFSVSSLHQYLTWSFMLKVLLLEGKIAKEQQSNAVSDICDVL
jgi:hypothetical protein